MRLLLFLLIPIQFYSQEAETKNKKIDFVFSPGIILQHQFFGEMNIIIGTVTVEEGKIPVVGIDGFRLGFEANFKEGNEFIFAPKVGYELSATAFTIRLSAANYYKDKVSGFRVIPEIGFSIYGFANLTYGYGISLNNSDINKLSNHRVSLSFNLDKRLYKEVFKK